MKKTFKEIFEYYGWKSKISLFVYGVVCNTPVCFCLCFTSTLIANMQYSGSLFPIFWPTLFVNLFFAFILAMCVTLFIPLIQIGKWFTALFNVDNHTFTGNIRYRLLATLSYTAIFFIVITPTLNILNSYIFPLLRGTNPVSFKNGMINLGLNVPFMLIVGYLSSLLFDLPAYQLAHKINPEF